MNMYSGENPLRGSKIGDPVEDNSVLRHATLHYFALVRTFERGGPKYDVPTHAFEVEDWILTQTEHSGRALGKKILPLEFLRGHPLDIVATRISEGVFFSGYETVMLEGNTLRRLIPASDFGPDSTADRPAGLDAFGTEGARANVSDSTRFSYANGIFRREVTFASPILVPEHVAVANLKTREGFSAGAKEYLDWRVASDLAAHLF